MRVMPIWELWIRWPKYNFIHWKDRKIEEIWAWCGRKVPKKLAYWCFIAIGVKYIHYDELVPSVTFCDVLERIEC